MSVAVSSGNRASCCRQRPGRRGAAPTSRPPAVREARAARPLGPSPAASPAVDDSPSSPGQKGDKIEAPNPGFHPLEPVVLQARPMGGQGFVGQDVPQSAALLCDYQLAVAIDLHVAVVPVRVLD